MGGKKNRKWGAAWGKAQNRKLLQTQVDQLSGLLRAEKVAGELGGATSRGKAG